MFRRSLLATVALLACVACEGPQDPDDGLPPLAWEGDRVLFATDLTDDVCAGTVAWLDAAVVSIEAELQLEPNDKTIVFYLLTPELVDQRCSPTEKACVRDGKVYSSPSGWENARHELVHARLDQLGIWGKPLFYEGIAAALDKDGGCLASESCMAANLNDLLDARTSVELADIDGYKPGADLVHGLLQAHGPEAVLAFMAELSRDTPPDEVRSIYLEHFGGVLDEDFLAFMRSPFDDYTIAQRGCDGTIPLTVSNDGSFALEAAMDCSSPDVQNYANDAVRGTTSWSFEVTPGNSGAFSVWADSEDPFVTPQLTLQMCHPPEFGPPELQDLGPYHFQFIWHGEGETVILPTGQYRLTWIAKVGATIDVTLAPECVFESGGCPEGERCTIWNQCAATAESPASLGESCVEEPGGPLACEPGSRCTNGVCVAECDSTQSCSIGEVCSRIRVCGPACDLLTQDCGPGFSCIPTGDDNQYNSDGIGACIPAGALSYLDDCDTAKAECSEGLGCEGIAPPSGSPCSAVMGGGCCVPFCDAKSAAPVCPDELGTCDPIRDGPVGICRI